MAVNLATTYGGQVNTGVPGYPYGQPRDETNDGSGDGLPYQEAWGRDLHGFLQAALVQGNVVPTNNPDTSLESQILGALMRVMGTASSIEIISQSAGAINLRAVNRTHANLLPFNVPLYFRTGAGQVNVGATLTLQLPDGSTEVLITPRVLFANTLYNVVRVAVGVLTVRGEPDVLQDAYPVNSLYISTSPTNPATTFGFGTWVAFGAGRVLLGAGSNVNDGTGDIRSFVGGTTGGEFDVALSEAQMPEHNHTATQGAHSHISLHGHCSTTARPTGFTAASSGVPGLAPFNFGGGTTDDGWRTSFTTSSTPAITVGDTGSGTAHNNMQPYVVVYMWLRTG